MRSRRSLLASLGALAFLFAGCAGDVLGEAPPGDGVPTPPPPSLFVLNQSQFPLLAVKVHPSSDHTAATNLLDELNAGDPLEPDTQIEIVAFASGDYVTIVREQVQNGPRIAITTGVRIELGGSPRTLLVFDESFRLSTP